MREAPDATWVIGSDVAPAIELIDLVGLDNFDVISFDHDLGDGREGYAVMLHVEECIRNRSQRLVTDLRVHSANPPVERAFRLRSTALSADRSAVSDSPTHYTPVPSQEVGVLRISTIVLLIPAVVSVVALIVIVVAAAVKMIRDT